MPVDAHPWNIGTMARRGPFTTYKSEYCGLARNFCLAADATLRDGGSPHRGADAWTEEEAGLMRLTDNAALLSSFGKRKSKKPLDRTEQCCGVSLPTLT